MLNALSVDRVEALRSPLRAGEPIRYWRLGALYEARYDVPDAPMLGEMDALFFLTKHKNFVPHEYPCRTAFAAEHRDRRPTILAASSPARWWLPHGSPRVDLSGFWFRATRIAAWAHTQLDAAVSGAARLRLSTCGGAVLFINGKEVGWLAPYTRNLETSAYLEVELRAGRNEVALYFDDLAERDARFIFQLDYLSGPTAENVVDVPIAAGAAAALEAILHDLRFDRITYLGGSIVVLFARPLPMAVLVRVEVEGDFVSAERLAFDFNLPRGATHLDLGPSERLPADFRHFTFTFDASGFLASRTLGVEICHVSAQGDPPAALSERISEALDAVAESGERDTVRALARLATGRGGVETDAMILSVLPSIEECHDCADFALVPLLWARALWGDAIAVGVRERVDRAILNYRYWMDEPGNDVQWYFSENHALLFHTAAYLGGALLPEKTFVRSGRKGAEQSVIGAARVRAWLDHFEQWEMAEFNSAPYFPIDLKGLTALAALASDTDIRERAWRGVVRLLEIVARSAHHGMLTAAQGRSYEHSLRSVRSLELSAIARLCWARGWYGRRFHALPQLALCLRDHGLVLRKALARIARQQSPSAVEWRFAQGRDRFAALYHYKSRAYAMGSAARYRWNQWGYQETVLHLRLGDRPEAQIWINHPGEVIQFGSGRPSYWGGSGSLPRAHQYRGLAVLVFDAKPEQPDFTHAWFPVAEFDEQQVDGSIAMARSGDGLVFLKGSRAFHLVPDGPTAGAELRLPGRSGCWIIRLADRAACADLAALRSDFAALEAAQDADGSVSVTDPIYGEVIFRADGTVRAEGRVLDPADWSIEGDAHSFAREASKE